MRARRSFFRVLGCLVLGGLGAFSFYAYQFAGNWAVHARAIRFSAEHPSLIPSKTSIDLFGAGFGRVVAQAYYVRSIQYVGSFLRSSEYKQYLYPLLNAITDLDPALADAYTNGPIFLAFQTQGEPFTEDQQRVFAQQAVQLAKKGIRNMCDPEKIRAIQAGTVDIAALAKDPRTAEPCGKYDDIPYYLGYILFKYLHQEGEASVWYQVAAAHKAAAHATTYMAALLEGKAGDRAKASLALLSLAQARAGDNTVCAAAAMAASEAVFREYQSASRAPQTSTVLGLEKLRDGWTPVEGDRCQENFARAVREISLAYLEAADAKFFVKKNRHAQDAAELAKAGLIPFVPVDPAAPAGVEYFYNASLGRWDWGHPAR